MSENKLDETFNEKKKNSRTWKLVIFSNILFTLELLALFILMLTAPRFAGLYIQNVISLSIPFTLGVNVAYIGKEGLKDYGFSKSGTTEYEQFKKNNEIR